MGDAASRRGLSRVGYIITLNGPLNGHPPSIIITRRVPVQRAIERDEIPYPYKVHDTTLRPLLNITIKLTIVVRIRSRSCGGGDICGPTPA